MIEPCKTGIVAVCFFLLAAFSAYAQQPAPVSELAPEEQRGNIGVSFGATTDRFGALPSSTTGLGMIDGQYSVIQSNAKRQTPDIVLGGEVRLPLDTSNNQSTSTHADEFAGFVGPMFHFGDQFSLGFRAQVRRIDLPTSLIDGQVFIRDNLLLLELPIVAEYRFGSAHNAFIRAEGLSEFSPHYTNSSNGASPFPKPGLDHAYAFRGTVGYSLGKWYLSGTYENRYFKFNQTLGNPDNFYNWKTNFVTAGVGLNF